MLQWFALLAFLSLNTTLVASSHLQMMDTTILMIEGEQACSGDTVTIAITSNEFNDVTGFQFSFSWDPNQANLLDTCNTFDSNINFNAVGSNNVVVTWLEGSGGSASLPPGDTLIVFKMNVLDIPPGGIPVNFGPLSPAEVIVATSNGTSIVTPITIDGLITFNNINSQAMATPINCIDTLSTLNATASGESPSFEWYYNGNLYAQTADTLANNSGLYTLIATSGHCIDTSFIQVDEDTAEPNIQEITPDTLSCTNTAIILSANTAPGQSNFWLFPGQDTLQIDSITVDSAGLYYLQVVDNQNGCFSIDTIEVIDISNFPEIVITGDTLLDCSTETISLLANSSVNATAYAWQDELGALLSDSAQLFISTPGLYELIVTDISSGCQSSDSILIEENTIAPFGEIAEYGTLNCITDTIFLETLNLSDNVLVCWLDDVGMQIPMGQITEAGFYIMKLIDTLNTCTFLDTIEVEASINLPEVDILFDTPNVISCENEMVEAESISNETDIAFLWQNVNSDTIAQTGTITFTQAGSYTLTATNLLNACAFDTTITITENLSPPQLDITLLQAFDCTLEQAALSTIASPLYLYEWSSEQGSINILSPAEAITTVSATGLYTLEVTNTENGCTANGSINVTSISSQITSVDLETPQVDCESLTDGILLINNINGIDTTFQYAVDNATNFVNTPLFTGLTIGEHQLFIADPDGCVYDTTFFITGATGHEVFIDVSQNPIKPGDTVTLNALPNISQENIVDIQWFDNSLLCDSCTLSINVNPTVSTTYLVQTTDNQGCIGEAIINLLVDASIGVYVPNAFSPNGDGQNDVFYIHTDDNIKNIKEMSVFSRWGKLVFNKKNFAPNDPLNGWDGTSLGEELDPAVFVYYIQLELVNGNEALISGDIMLIN